MVVLSLPLAFPCLGYASAVFTGHNGSSSPFSPSSLQSWVLIQDRFFFLDGHYAIGGSVISCQVYTIPFQAQGKLNLLQDRNSIHYSSCKDFKISNSRLKNCLSRSAIWNALLAMLRVCHLALSFISSDSLRAFLWSLFD